MWVGGDSTVTSDKGTVLGSQSRSQSRARENSLSQLLMRSLELCFPFRKGLGFCLNIFIIRFS